MKRIIVVGSGGAGKTMLAIELGRRLGLPVHHLDKLNWKPGWVPTPADEWRKIQDKLVQEDSWIIDGNYGGTIDLRIAAADTVIFLDFPRLRCLWNSIKRLSRFRGRNRPDMGAGCLERFKWDYIKWIWGFGKTSRPRILALLHRYSREKKIHVLHSPREIESFLMQQAPISNL